MSHRWFLGKRGTPKGNFGRGGRAVCHVYRLEILDLGGRERERGLGVGHGCGGHHLVGPDVHEERHRGVDLRATEEGGAESVRGSKPLDSLERKRGA